MCLLLAIVVLSFTPLHSIFKFSNVIRRVLFCDPSVSIRLIILPFSLILDIELLIDLKSSSLFLAIDPFSSVKVSVCIQHGSVAVGPAVKLLTLVTVFFDDSADLSETRGLSLA